MQLPAYTVQVQGPGKCTGCEIESQAFLKREGSFQVSLGEKTRTPKQLYHFTNLPQPSLEAWILEGVGLKSDGPIH